MSSSQKPTFGYTNRVYSLKEFEEFDHQLKTHELLIAKTPVNHFEMSQRPKCPSEIAAQLRNWKVQIQQNGVVTSSQGCFNFGGAIRAPDVSFSPKKKYRGLTDEQLYTFQGPPFAPTFAVEG